MKESQINLDISAEEALKMTNNYIDDKTTSHYNLVKEAIVKEIKSQSGKTQISYDGTIYPSVKKQLEDEGFLVTSRSSIKNESWYEISWAKPKPSFL